MRYTAFSRRDISAYVFLLPGLTIFSFTILLPFLMGINIAFTDWNGIARDYSYVGFANFARIFGDLRIQSSIVNSLEFCVLGTIFGNVVSLGLALVINSRVLRRGRFGTATSQMARIIFFMPVCVSAILSAFLWGYIYRDVFYKLFEINSLLGNKNTVIPAIVGIGLWNTQGINMLIYYSGLKSIPADLYEAAIVDGASVLTQFRKITVPMLMPSFTVCVTLTMTSWLREFATTLAATAGGPAGASRTISIYIYQNLFTYNRAGYGQAMAIAFTICLIALGTTVSSFFRKREVRL